MGAWKDTGCISSESKRCKSYDTEEPDDLANPTILLTYSALRRKVKERLRRRQSPTAFLQ